MERGGGIQWFDLNIPINEAKEVEKILIYGQFEKDNQQVTRILIKVKSFCLVNKLKSIYFQIFLNSSEKSYNKVDQYLLMSQMMMLCRHIESSLPSRRLLPHIYYMRLGCY